jgi:hypothetical protein
MAWKYGDRTLRVGKAWVDDENFKHPYRWVQWSAEDKKKWGVTWEDDPTPLAPYDHFYYSGYDSDGNLVGRTLATLQSEKVTQEKEQAANYLKSTDWYVVRKIERDVAIPSEITAHRLAVVTNYESLKTAINDASDVDGLKALYETTAGASSTAKEIDATSSSVVSTSGNTIKSNGHGFVNDEQVYYDVGVNSDKKRSAAIGGLKDQTTYFVHSATTNTFKLSESHSNCGDEAIVSLTGLSSDGTKQTFTSQGKPGKGQTWPNSDMPKYDGA